MPQLDATPRFIMIGGFLGAGKTTAVLKIAERFRGRGLRCGLITNDQSFGLVDTTMLDFNGFDVEEITGGCFCCRFNSLVEASEKLSAGDRPDVFIAEPVGSCTDLKATVDYPLRRMYGSNFSMAPLSVMLDPIRASRILGLENGKNFSPKVVYIYRKQLEEADLIVVNKIDLLEPAKADRLIQLLGCEFPVARIIGVSARFGDGLDEWMAGLESIQAGKTDAMQVDYQVYAEGESLLGWLNAAAEIKSLSVFDGNAFVLEIATRIQEILGTGSSEVAHLKLTLAPSEGNDLAVANLVRGDARPELSHHLQAPMHAGELIVNLRAENGPEPLKAAVLDVFRQLSARDGIKFSIRHMEAFRPGKPTPTHRLQNV